MTPEREAEERRRVVEISKTWLRTPYHNHGRVRGAGVDCAMLIAEVYEEAGVAPHVEPKHYPPDWHLHRDEERYLAHVLPHARELPEGSSPGVGDLVLVRFGRAYSHGAIVVAWPLCIHAMMRLPVGYVDALQDAVFREKSGALRPMKFFSVWPREA